MQGRADVTQILPGRDIVGESLIWDDQRQSLFWVDIAGRLIRQYCPSDRTEAVWAVPEFPTSIGLRTDGGFVVGLTRAIALWDLGGAFEPLATPEPNFPGNRLNEGRVAPDGSFWVGTMQNNLQADGSPKEIKGKAGRYYRIGHDGGITLLTDDLYGITNTMAWLPDGRFVTADTSDNALYVYDIDPSGQALRNRRRFAAPYHAGFPDGSCLDAEGGLWTCRVAGGYAVTRTMLDGSVDRVIDLPCSWPTSCTFGGADLATLYVTSARFTMTEEHLQNHPEEGGVFALTPGVVGAPENRFQLGRRTVV